MSSGAAALAALLLLYGCGDAGGTTSTPAPVASPAPTPTPAPTPSPTPTPALIPAASFDTTEYRRSTGPSFQNAIPAWQLGATGKGVTLAIIDTGIDTTNPEFAGRISGASADIVGNRGLDNPDSSHGTQVALTAAAARDGLGIMGVAWDATIQMLRADSAGSCATYDAKVPDSGCGFFDTAIASGVDRAIAAGAKVINISLGGSPPNGALSAAIGRAAAAGIVVVVSAGNDGKTSTTEVDPLAAGIRQAGSGNVIIAGSVNASGVLSDFSNRAGAEANAYLAALGEKVCCVYENGQIKITTDASGTRFVTVVSGTSFAAPQIAGAAALLRQYFPNLTGAQVVDLLLRTARDAGATGTDNQFGRGILDIGNAFAPQGTTVLADSGSQLALADTALVTSAAMGNAAQSANASAVVLDAYQRAYTINLGQTMRSAQAMPRLGNALAAPVRNLNLGGGALAMAFSVADPRRTVGMMPWAGQLRLSPQDAEGARVLAARIITRLSPRATMAFAYAAGLDGIVAQLQGQSRPAFLVSGDPFSDTGFARRGLTALALRRTLGRYGLTLSAENGTVQIGTVQSGYASSELAPMRKQDRFIRLGLSLDRQFGPLQASLGASWLAEQGTVLGARLHPALGGRGAETGLLDLGLGWSPDSDWRLGAMLRQGWTRARVAGAVTGGSRLASTGWALDVSRLGLFGSADSLSFRLSQPLRVTSGGLNLDLPVAYSYDTMAATNGIRHVNLAPTGREISRELAWRGALAGGGVTASLYWRSQPGHFTDLPDDLGMGFSWERQF